MLIGKAGAATTAISTADAASLTVRGRDFCGDLMGRLSFTEYFHLLVTGREPSESQRFFLDLLLVAIAEHGLVPTNQAARMTYAADPRRCRPRWRPGILGCGSVVLGTTEALRGVPDPGAGADGGRGGARDLVAEIRERGRQGAGVRPSAAQARPSPGAADHGAGGGEGTAGAARALARAAEAVVPRVWGKPLPMNVSMPIAAVLLDLDFPPAILKGIPILARTASLLAHLAEESERPDRLPDGGGGRRGHRLRPRPGA